MSLNFGRIDEAITFSLPIILPNLVCIPSVIASINGRKASLSLCFNFSFFFSMHSVKYAMVGSKLPMNVSTSPCNNSIPGWWQEVSLYFRIKQEIQARSLETCNYKKILFYNVAIFFLNLAQNFK